jgi:hypothetical protein
MLKMAAHGTWHNWLIKRSRREGNKYVLQMDCWLKLLGDHTIFGNIFSTYNLVTNIDLKDKIWGYNLQVETNRRILRAVGYFLV